MKALAIAAIVIIIISAGCISQQQPLQETYVIKKHGIEYVFSNPIEKSSHVPVSGENEILERIVFADVVRIVFESNEDDNAAFQLAGIEIASKLSHFYVYGQGRFVDVQATEIGGLNATGATVIQMKSSGTGAGETSVYIDENGRIVVEGRGPENLTLAADRLALIYLED